MSYVDFPILEVASRCGIAVDYDSNKVEIEANCPFCNDRKKHLSFNTTTDQFRCNRCKESGNSISLYAKIHSIDNKTAFRELTEGNTYRYPIHEKKALPQVRQYEIKPLGKRHDTYYDMLQRLKLSPAHRRQLMNRGLDNATIDRNMYRTVPAAGTKLYSDLLYNLSREHNLAGIPGFYKKGGKWRMVTKNGLFVPVCSHQGYIQGLQIRLDDDSNRKYRWFSSNHYDCGTRIYPWIHVANWNNGKTAYITEGAMKAEVASYLMGGVCIIGLTGVNCINGLSGLLRELGTDEIIEALDMDKFTNQYVSDALSALKSSVLKEGIKYRSATWNPSFKGLDDFYLALRKQQVAAAA